MKGVMDIRSEQKSQFLPYHSDVVSRARPPAIRRPNNLHLIGNIELFPEYKSKYISHNFTEVDKINRVPCFHTKRGDKKSKKVHVCNGDENRNYDTQYSQDKDEARHTEMEPRKLYHNNDSSARFHEKFDCENNNYIPEYRSKYGSNLGEKSALIPQHSHFMKYDGDNFNCTSEYNNRYKSYDQFTKSAPIKKEDNLYMKGQAQMQPEYKNQYKEIDLKSYVRQQPIKHQNNLYPDGNFLTEMPEYAEKYKRYNSNAMPEKSKGREDFFQLSGDMDYDTLHRSNYVEFPRQRPIVRKPSTHIQLSSQSPREERKPDNLNLPINVPYHESNVMKQVRDDNDDEVPFECTPEYRKAMRNYMLKERSPTRGSPSNEKKQNEKVNSNIKITIDHNDVSKILTENKVNVPEEKIFNEQNEVIVEPLKIPDGFKIPTRSPTSLNLGRVPTYPIDKNSFNERASIARKPRKHYDVSFEDDDKPKNSTEDFVGDFDEEDTRQFNRQPQHQQQGHYQENYERPPPHPNQQGTKKRSPPVKFGRRATNPKEDYMIRKKTSVIEGNSTYTRDYCANRHEQKAYPHHRKTNALPFANPPADALANNYRPNYELDKQVSYREALGNREPFVVLDRESQQRNKLKQSSWMKKQWYDTN